MKFIPPLLGALTVFAPAVAALNILRSTSLAPCMDRSGFSATLFNVSFTPDDGQLKIQIKGGSTIIGDMLAKVTVLAYGFPVMSQELDPCSTDGLRAMCPMTLLPLDLNFQQTVEKATVDQIPVIAYKIPDLDGIARMEVVERASGKVVACVEAPLSNGQTVEQAGVGWASALISGLGLLSSAVVSGMGYSSTAAHIAANALSIFGYFQAQAMIAMMAVPLPPLAAAWVQNYDWAVGIININFMQRIFHWYVQATKGKPANLFRQQESVSVQIAKRSLEASKYLTSRAAAYGFAEVESRSNIVARSNNDALAETTEVVRVTGIERMSYKATIESTNFFLTGMSFFVAFCVLVVLLVGGFRLLCATGLVKNDRFREFRLKWLVVLKGIMYRVVLIGFPQMALLSLWELTHRDSPAVVVLAVFFFLFMAGTLGWACYKILTIGKHSSVLDPTLGPAYTLYSDPAALNRWGYLYVQFRTERYYHIVPLLLYIMSKAIVIAFAQDAGVAQSLIILVIELVYLIVVCYLRPFLDRRTNIVNIGIASINFLNSILVMVFSGVTKAPDMVPGIMGVIFFIMNAVFALVLLVLLLVAVGFALFSKNPEARYRGANALPQDEKKSPRDLDADPTLPPSHGAHSHQQQQQQAHSLHDLSLRGDRGDRDIDAESERAVGIDRGMSIREQRSPQPVWSEGGRSAAFDAPTNQGQGAMGQGTRRGSPSVVSALSERPSMQSSRGSRRTGTMTTTATGGTGREGRDGREGRVESVFAPPSAAMYDDRERGAQGQGHGQRQDWNRGAGFE